MQQKIRPGYKQTEVGVIPEDWDCLRIAELASRKSNAIVGGPFGSDLVATDYVPVGVPVIRGQNMSGRFVSGEFAFVSPDKADNLKANTASPGDVVFTQRGTLGQVCMVPDTPFSSYVVSQSQMKLSVDKEKIEAGFLIHFFHSEPGRRKILDSAIQTGVPHTNLGILRSYRLPVPPLPEQRAIAEALGDADARIAALEAVIAKKRDLKQAAMQQLLTGKTRLPSFSGAWEVKRLGECCNFFKGKGLPKSAISTSGEFPCIHYGELFTFYGVTINEVASKTDQRENAFLSQRNDVLMPTSDVTPRGLAKASCLLIDGVVLGGDTLVIRPADSLLNGQFLAAQVRYREKKILALVTGSTVFHLYASDMRKFELPVPTLAEQIAIAEILSDMDADLAAVEAEAAKARAIKQGMMQTLLTGQVRLV